MANNNHFELTLDTLAPSGAITRGTNIAHNDNFDLGITKGDATYMKVWFDNDQTGTKTSEGYIAAAWIAAANTFTTELTTDDTVYYHLVLMDTVGNESEVYNTEAIQFDKTAPVTPRSEAAADATIINNGASYTNHKNNNTIKFTFADNLSGSVEYKLVGNIDNSDAWVAISSKESSLGEITATFNFSTGAEDDTQTVEVYVKDAAGNVSVASQDSIILDTEDLDGHLALYDTDDTASVTEFINYHEVVARIDANSAEDWKDFKVWEVGGDEPTDWTPAPTTGSPATAHVDMTLSAGEGLKTVKAVIRDNADNETELAVATVTIDESAPTVTIVADRQYVSKVTGYTSATITPTINAAISGVKSYQLYLNDSEYPLASGNCVAYGTGKAFSVGTKLAYGGTVYTVTSAIAAEDNTSWEACADKVEALTFVVDSSEMGDGGAKVEENFTLKVIDNADNETTSAGVIIYLDTVAPEITGITMSAWYNGDDAEQDAYTKFSEAGVTVTVTDSGAGITGGAAQTVAWCSTVATETSAPTTAVKTNNCVSNLAHNQVDWSNHAESATNYIHIEYTDAVGNKQLYHSSAFGIDTVRPGNGSIAFSADAYNTRAASVAIASDDITSGISKMKVWGAIQKSSTDSTQVTLANAEWENYAESKSVTLYGADGMKTINILFKDVAGNVSATAQTDTAELDTVAPSAELDLYMVDGETSLPAEINFDNFVAHITGHEDAGAAYVVGAAYNVGDRIYNPTTLKRYEVQTAITAAENTSFAAISSKLQEVTPEVDPANVEYCLYGDFAYEHGKAQGVTEEAAGWTPIGAWDTGKTYKTIGTLYATTGDGTKTVYLKLRDNAGNITSATPRSFVYDTTAPTVTVSGVDYNIVSKVNTLRRTADGETAGKYNDEVNFVFTPDSEIQAYKVCAYLDKAAAEAGSHEDAPIKQSGEEGSAGSTNMHATGLKQAAPVSAMIKGADYEAALGEVGEVDGAHYVVVYVQDLGGTWSVAAEFEA